MDTDHNKVFFLIMSYQVSPKGIPLVRGTAQFTSQRQSPRQLDSSVFMVCH